MGIVLQGSSTITYGTVGALVDGNRQSRAFGIIYSASSAAAIIGPISFGFVGDHFGVGAALLAMAVVVLLTVPVAALLRPALVRVAA